MKNVYSYLGNSVISMFWSSGLNLARAILRKAAYVWLSFIAHCKLQPSGFGSSLLQRPSSAPGLLLTWPEWAEWDSVQFLLSLASVVVWGAELVAQDSLSFSVTETLLMPWQYKENCLSRQWGAGSETALHCSGTSLECVSEVCAMHLETQTN